MPFPMEFDETVSNLARVVGFRFGEDEVFGPGEVHVWLQAASGVDVREAPPMARANNHDSQEALTAVLSVYTGTRDLNFLRGPHGKPYLEGGPHFNLSHSAGATAIAVGPVEVGLDIEHPARPVSAEGVAEKFFAKEELEQLMAVPARERQALFLRYWVCKEAMTKLTGDGIYRGLRFAKVGMDGAHPSGSYRNRPVVFSGIGEEVVMTGALASWEPVRVKVFVIPPKSAIML